MQNNSKKQQLEQSVSDYEKTLKQQEDKYNKQNVGIVEQNKQIEQENKAKQDEYEQKKKQYDTDLANFENTKNDTVESSVPTGDNMNNTLRMFTLSMLGLCVAYVFKEKIK